MASQTIISLAILKVNWDLLRKDYLENFVPIVAQCIKLSQHEVVSLPELQKDLRVQFGLRFPQNAIKTLLTRVQKRGYVRLEDKVYKREPDKLSDLQFPEVQQKVVRMHEALIRSLVAFCSEKFSVTWSVQDAEAAFQSYLEDNQLLIVAAATQGNLIPDVTHSVKGAKFLVGAFVKHLQETHSADFEYFETIVKGNMLANAVFLPEPSQADRKFKKTEIYFDTSFLMFALGYVGQPRKDPCVELLILLYETGADLRCFRHTLDEVRGALDACAHRIERGQLRDAYGPSIDFFLSQGYSASDIELFSVQLERNLRALRVLVVDKPQYIREYVIDEQGLSRALESQITYRNPQALVRDVDSISAIMRLRRGAEFFFIEDCRALFVTTNSILAKVSREFFYGESTPGAVSPCLTDYTLTNLLWLKKPFQAPDLPRKRIIADCYAAMQPDEHLWKRYLSEIEKLERTQTVTTDDVYSLRHSLEAKVALMELTLGAEQAFTQATVSEILQLIHSRKYGELEQQLVSEAELRKATEKALQSQRAREINRLSHVRVSAQRYARVTALTIQVVVVVLLATALLSTFPWQFPSITSAWFKYLLATLQVGLLPVSKTPS